MDILIRLVCGVDGGRRVFQRTDGVGFIYEMGRLRTAQGCASVLIYHSQTKISDDLDEQPPGSYSFPDLRPNIPLRRLC